MAEDAIGWSTLLSSLPTLTDEEDVLACRRRVLIGYNKDVGYLPYQSVDKDVNIILSILKTSLLLYASIDLTVTLQFTNRKLQLSTTPLLKG